MKIDENIYPYNKEVFDLPFFLSGIGGTEYQYHLIRMDGYKWHQILFCAHGTRFLQYDGLTVSLKQGDFFFLPAGYPHEYYSDNEKWDVRWVSFDGYACAHLLSQFNMTKPIVISPQESSALQNIYNNMFTSQISDKLYCDFYCAGLIYDYIIEFHRFMDNKIIKVRNERNKLLLPVFNYIDEHFQADFPLTVLAEIAGVTPQHLCRIFKESVNMRPNEYLTRRRLLEAKSLIQRNELPISDIARQSGFPDAAYFSTVFKKYEGVSPMEYRKRLGLK